MRPSTLNQLEIFQNRFVYSEPKCRIRYFRPSGMRPLMPYTPMSRRMKPQLSSTFFLPLQHSVAPSFMVEILNLNLNFKFRSENPFDHVSDWLIAVEALMGAALLCLLISLLLISIYMCVHTVSKNSTIIALVFFSFFAC